ncbi:MAG: ankyrin repeat domain-containing protein [Acidimicrobiales bacterium]
MTDFGDFPALRDGLDAWRRWDLDGIERSMHPAVTLRAIQPGPWDCENREQVMALLRQRAEQRHGTQPGEVDVRRLDEATFLVTGLGNAKGTATLVTVNDGLVVAMQQVSTDAPSQHAADAAAAVRSGDIDALVAALDAHPRLATDPVPGCQGRTLLHLVTDWPGYWPNGPEIVQLVIERGGDPNHRGGDNHEGETPLHWAASSDDADVAAALIDGGADIEAPDGSIGTPLDNAIGYGCWNVARLLADRGARIDKLWHAAALGKSARLEALLTSDPDRELISQAFWHACGAGQRRTAERLLRAGADLDSSPGYAAGTALDAARGRFTQQENVVEWLRSLGARETSAVHSEE